VQKDILNRNYLSDLEMKNSDLSFENEKFLELKYAKSMHYECLTPRAINT